MKFIKLTKLNGQVIYINRVLVESFEEHRQFLGVNCSRINSSNDGWLGRETPDQISAMLEEKQS